jgi:hypothetical protein
LPRAAYGGCQKSVGVAAWTRLTKIFSKLFFRNFNAPHAVVREEENVLP